MQVLLSVRDLTTAPSPEMGRVNNSGDALNSRTTSSINDTESILRSNPGGKQEGRTASYIKKGLVVAVLIAVIGSIGWRFLRRKRGRLRRDRTSFQAQSRPPLSPSV